MDKLILKCPIRGILKASKKSKDGLTPTEEYFRVEAIKHLIKVGYPLDHFLIEPVLKRFGAANRNSFRSDFAVLDVPITTINCSDITEVLNHSILLCEVKRDNSKYDYVKTTQVEPMLDFAKLKDCIGLYWANTGHRVFWRTSAKGKLTTHDGPLPFLPKYGNKIKVLPLTFNSIQAPDSLLSLLSSIENILHAASIDLEPRYEAILQLLLAKLFDEHEHSLKPTTPVGFQDFQTLGVKPNQVKKDLNKLLGRAVDYYRKHLPKPVGKAFDMSDATLTECAQLLAPVKIIAAKRDVIQTFYMKFAKDLYKWDLAQYFTPTTVTDFIVEALNPQFAEHVHDPACGSADFLIAAYIEVDFLTKIMPIAFQDRTILRMLSRFQSSICCSMEMVKQILPTWIR